MYVTAGSEEDGHEARCMSDVAHECTFPVSNRDLACPWKTTGERKSGCTATMALQEAVALWLWLCKKRLCRGCGFERCFWPCRFVPLLLLCPSPRLSISTYRAVPALNCVTERKSHLPLSPFAFSSYFSHQLSSLVPFAAQSVPQRGWGLPGWGRECPKGTEDFLCLWVDVWSTGYFICLGI